MSSIDTMSYWPFLVESIAALPPRYTDAFMQYTGRKDCSSMYAVYAPQIFWLCRGGQLICIDGDTLYFFGSKAAGLCFAKVSAKDLNYIRRKNCLLSSELTFNVLQGGECKNMKTEYNTVREELYQPVLDFFRGPRRDNAALLRERDERYMHLLRENFKLLNMGVKAYDREGGSKAHFYQDAIYQKKRWFRKKITSGFLYISTENEFIAVEDIDHGTEYHFMRKSAIRGAKIVPGPEGLSQLVVEFTHNSLAFPVAEENCDALRSIL